MKDLTSIPSMPKPLQNRLTFRLISTPFLHQKGNEIHPCWKLGDVFYCEVQDWETYDFKEES